MAKNKFLKDLEFLPQAEGFLGIEEDYLENYHDANAVVVPFGLESTVSYGMGTRTGARAIIKASRQLETFDEEHWSEVFRDIGISTLKEPTIEVSIQKALEQLEKITEKLLNADKFPLILGGEHSITAGVIKPFIKKYPDLAILHFDAHAELKDDYKGEKYSHRTVIRRVMDLDISTLVSCGIRNISAKEVKYYEENKKRINIHFAKDHKTWDIKEIIKPLKGRPVYITFDLDAFDSSLMQATGTPEPGGLFWNDVTDIIHETSKISTIVGADVVELAPVRQLHACDFLAAKLCYKILGYAFGKKVRN